MRRAKIVATIGPASDSPELLDRLLEAGMDVARLNFSHGTQAEQGQRIARLRQAAAAHGAHPDHAAGPARAQDPHRPPGRGRPGAAVAGQRLTITTRPVEGSAEVVGTGYAGLPRDVKPGDRILALGRADRAAGPLQHRGRRADRGGDRGRPARAPGDQPPPRGVSTAALTEKDEADLAFGLAQGVDWIALSFVRRAEDVLAVKERIAGAGKSTPVMAKIEKPEALDHLPAILEAADGIMVARGDLGVEMPPAEVPVVQKRLIAACNSAGKPVITATQMLESMIAQPPPHPGRGQRRGQRHHRRHGRGDAQRRDGGGEVPRRGGGHHGPRSPRWWRPRAGTGSGPPSSPGTSCATRSVAEAISAAAVAVERVLQVEGIVAYTRSGNTARLVSRLRPRARVFGFTPDEATARRINLLWGVTPVLCAPIPDLAGLERAACGTLLAQGALKRGDEVVLTGGHPLLEAAETNLVKVVRL